MTKITRNTMGKLRMTRSSDRAVGLFLSLSVSFVSSRAVERRLLSVGESSLRVGSLPKSNNGEGTFTRQQQQQQTKQIKNSVMCRLALIGLALACALVAAFAAAQDGGVWKVKFDVQYLDGKEGEDGNGSFVMEVHDAWAPLGAARWKEMVQSPTFFKDIRFFRAVRGFVLQAGIAADPQEAAQWRSKVLTDDPVVHSNKRGTVTFATSGANSRTTQFFINLADRNTFLDGMGFSPFGVIDAENMKVVDRFYFGFAEKPNQGLIQSQGAAYLGREFPQLTRIVNAQIIE